ncbi:MAG: carbon starvation protein A [Verrucomicrobia bacterium]|jgi:carbon starvation protein CstA|nr:carbon starvation protein A [Verrucomicrobiota bacterium]OQC65405.1 MAG: Carbon starvation protein A [Verrucomicrobia bacterium ADurb.Bin006]NMD21875.1 carbon starvation protein A [Verrucomicrobiota bacterium]HOA62168.1 carbon starvation CstA family protein [Verrucomicrobiota bacterium]HOG88205.1 carbon starvation CstA family protein [Verrucomicrobiota bacterium]
MIAFVTGLILLVGGYFFYGRVVAATVRPDPNRLTPAIALADGMDYVPMPTWRVYLIQLLNIAGLGPVFGPILGALWGPQVFLWVVLGCIFGGAVHDLLTGTMSIRNRGAGLPDLIGHYMGNAARQFSTFFILLLMVLVGTVFVKGPALLLVSVLPSETVGGWFGEAAKEWLSQTYRGHGMWLWIVMVSIYVYYLAATLLPIDKIIGRFYPFFAAALLVMVVGLGIAILRGQIVVPPFTLKNLHPEQLPAWPLIFITVSCGAVSGFHATQSPLMARCLKSERHLRLVFYGAMIAEGLIALVWASVAQGFYGSHDDLAAVLLKPGGGGPGAVVHDACTATMGVFGGGLAILGVVVLPITSGDTAFRVSRLILADYFHVSQVRFLNRSLLITPLFVISFALNFVDFSVIWRYFGWANQALAAVALWGGTIFLARRRTRWWLAFVPAVFMTVVTATYILVEDVGFRLNPTLGAWLGLLIGAAAAAWFLVRLPKLPVEPEEPAITARPTAAERSTDSLAC